MCLTEPNPVTDLCFVVPGSSVTTVLIQVSQGKRPSVEIIPERRPSECDQVISIMKQCWDQDRRKRPQFSGTKVKKGQKKRKRVGHCEPIDRKRNLSFRSVQVSRYTWWVDVFLYGRIQLVCTVAEQWECPLRCVKLCLCCRKKVSW